jgi:hypothetical protein
MADRPNRYTQIIERIFFRYFHEGIEEIPFERSEIIQAAEEIGINLPKNLGDVLYSFRYRSAFPENIALLAPQGWEWIIRPAGRGKYKFTLTKQAVVTPSPMLAETKILNATPAVIDKYALNDEQALLAKLRYNRLIDIFTGLTCYSLQNHLRTTVPEMGQVETDELYIGIDKRGAHYVLPVQAKGGSDRVGIVQIEQDFAMCKAKFPQLIVRPIAAQFVKTDLIAIFEFELGDEGISIVSEKHYRLVGSEDLSQEELDSYQHRPI